MEAAPFFRNELTYIDINNTDASNTFANIFYHHLCNKYKNDKPIIILCIGTDRVTGDSLGPLIGYKLKNIKFENVIVCGNLDNPVHAKNLKETLNSIYNLYNEPLIIAIDACLGRAEHIGYLTIGEGCIKPGSGVNKNLPEVGDIFITGIVNFNGIMDMLILQNTRLNLVMKMADIVSSGIILGLNKHHYSNKAHERDCVKYLN